MITLILILLIAFGGLAATALVLALCRMAHLADLAVGRATPCAPLNDAPTHGAHGVPALPAENAR